VEEVVVVSVNDGAVMKAWAKQQRIEGSFVRFLGDPLSDLTRDLGVLLEHPAVRAAGLVNRCKRFAMLFSKGVVKYFAVDGPDSKTYAEAVLKFMDDNPADS